MSDILKSFVPHFTLSNVFCVTSLHDLLCFKKISYCHILNRIQRYGDKCPKSILSRIFAIFWIVFGIALSGIFTASITTALTVSLSGNTVDIGRTKVSHSLANCFIIVKVRTRSLDEPLIDFFLYWPNSHIGGNLHCICKL